MGKSAKLDTVKASPRTCDGRPLGTDRGTVGVGRASVAPSPTRGQPQPSVAQHTSGTERRAVDSWQRSAVDRDGGEMSAVSNLPSPVPAVGPRGQAAFGRSVRGCDLRERQKGGFAVGPTKRGKGTKIVAIASGDGLPLAVSVASASPAECKLVEDVLAGCLLDELPARLISDKACDSDPLDEKLATDYCVERTSPNRCNRKQMAQDGRLLRRYRRRWKIGVSSQGHINQPVQVRPRPTDSSLVAGEAPWRESKTVKPSDNMLRKEYAQLTRLQCAVNADVASLHDDPEAETVYNARKQQEPVETSPMRRLSPAGYQRRHGGKVNVSTGEALSIRRRNLAEEMTAITTVL